MAAFDSDPWALEKAPRWRRNDICLENTAYNIRSRRGPLPPVKKDYKDPQKWVDPQFTVFIDKEPFLRPGGGIKKPKDVGPSTLSANPGPTNSSFKGGRRVFFSDLGS